MFLQSTCVLLYYIIREKSLRWIKIRHIVFVPFLSLWLKILTKQLQEERVYSSSQVKQKVYHGEEVKEGGACRSSLYHNHNQEQRVMNVCCDPALFSIHKTHDPRRWLSFPTQVNKDNTHRHPQINLCLDNPSQICLEVCVLDHSRLYPVDSNNHQPRHTYWLKTCYSKNIGHHLLHSGRNPKKMNTLVQYKEVSLIYEHRVQWSFRIVNQIIYILCGQVGA